jgi:MFS family permease
MTTESDASTTADDGTQTRGWLTPGVFGVGAASLCSDTSHELVTSLLPTFVTATLHAGPGVLGAIDGTADALSGLATLAGGPLANNPNRRARLARGGYLGTAVATAAIGLTTAVWQVAILRGIAWVSRGFRSPARDMLLTSLTRKDSYGRAFGVERAGDNAGAILGPLLASVLVAAVGVRHAILLSIIPGILAAVAITIAAREARRAVVSPVGRRTLALNLRQLRAAGFARTLTSIALFELGNVATTLLRLRATDLLRDGGRSVTAATRSWPDPPSAGRRESARSARFELVEDRGATAGSPAMSPATRSTASMRPTTRRRSVRIRGAADFPPTRCRRWRPNSGRTMARAILAPARMRARR